MLELEDGDYDEWQASQLFTWTYTNKTTSWLMHSWSIFGAWTSHRQTRIHKTHNDSDLWEATTITLIVFSMLGHGASTQISFCPGTPKLGIPKFLTFSGRKSNWLTPSPSFGHNLCFKYSNGTCEHILNNYVWNFFQWYKELFNPMSFDPCNRLLKIRESIRTPTPKAGTLLGVCGFIPSHFPTLPGFIFGPHLCKPLL
jgi:hypothetical protein